MDGPDERMGQRPRLTGCDMQSRLPPSITGMDQRPAVLYHALQIHLAQREAPGQACGDAVQQRLALVDHQGHLGHVQKEFDQVQSALGGPGHERTRTETIPVVEDERSIEPGEEIAVERIDRVSVVSFGRWL